MRVGECFLYNTTLVFLFFFNQAVKRQDEKAERQLEKQVQQLVRESKACQKDPKSFSAMEKATCVSKKPNHTYLDTSFLLLLALPK